jgi:hypothetical protein
MNVSVIYMISTQHRALLAASGLAGAGYAAWKTMFPWIGDDIQTIRALKTLQQKVQENLSNLICLKKM